MTGNTTILIVDDLEPNREILKSFWEEKENFELLEADGSEAAMRILMECSNVDLILLDVFMPGMSGLEFLKYLKGDDRLNCIPVIIITQTSETTLEEQALNLGAEDFILKPYAAGVVRKRVDNVIRKSLYDKSRRDELTGVYSCDMFYVRTRQMLLQDEDTKYVMCYFNITRFKVINELMGSREGDRILMEVADILKKACQGAGTYARITADHFACCIQAEHFRKGSRFYICLSSRLQELETKYQFRVECGVYEIKDINMPISVMCDKAKFAVLEMKPGYGNRFVLYDEKMGRRRQWEHGLVSDMENALKEGQFYVMLQPVYDALSGEPVSAEALVRWQHPEKGLISPADFVPLFERTGFVRKMDAFVREEVYKLLAAQKADGERMLPISINMSRVDLQESGLVEKIEERLASYGLDRQFIKLEVTETAYAENPSEIAAVVSKFRKQGFEVLMDDFGSGYSSLNILKELPVDILKIDMRFMDNFQISRRSGNILISIVRMAKMLKMETVAEGVETKNQVEFLRNIGCDWIQGYYFSKPLLMEDYRKVLREESDFSAEKEISRRGILVVDDVKTVRTSLVDALGRDYNYYEAANGKEALEILEKSAGQISLIITDIVMPQMDGFSLMREIQEDSIYSCIPLIVVTSLGEREDEIKALSLGAVDVITKPYDPIIVKHRVTNVLKLSEIEWLQMKIKMLAH